jgi:hypothetical protein
MMQQLLQQVHLNSVRAPEQSCVTACWEAWDSREDAGAGNVCVVADPADLLVGEHSVGREHSVGSG